MCQSIQEENNNVIIKVRSDHNKEFENAKFFEFCDFKGIIHSFSCFITSQQDGVVEQKTRAIQESARVMLHAKQFPLEFRDKAIKNVCYIHNMVTLREGNSTTLYELWKGRKSAVKYFHTFRNKCYLLIDKDQKGKKDPIRDEGVFMGYSSNM